MVILICISNKMATGFIIILSCLSNLLLVYILNVLLCDYGLSTEHGNIGRKKANCCLLARKGNIEQKKKERLMTTRSLQDL